MRKTDGSDYKEGVIKTIWNTTAKLVQQKYFCEYQRHIDPFKDITFKEARAARDSKRKLLQTVPDKRKMSSVAMTSAEYKNMCLQWDEDTPEGHQKKLFHIAAVELAWRVLPEFCAQTINVSPITTRKNMTDVTEDIQEYEELLPVIPGAEEIDSDLQGIVEDVLREENIVEYNAPEDESNPLSPVALEASQSFRHSPTIEIDELECSDITPTSTCTDRGRSLTPMPSPLNFHAVCDNEFCADHEKQYVLQVPSPSVSSASSSATNKSNATPKTTKKRPRRQKEWSDVKRKCLKNLGQKYMSKGGVAKDEKTLGLPCKCRYKCFDKISHQQRVDCFSKFWQLGDRAKQWHFIVKFSQKFDKKRCLNQATPNNRKYTYKYFLPLITDSNVSHCDTVPVCQTMFVNTLAVSTRILKTAWKKFDGTSYIEEDKRGRHDNHKTVLTDAMVQSVCDHVKSFVPVESHYIRKNSKKLYLNGDLSIAKMHKLYLEWFDAVKYTCKALKERQYRNIVNSHFNLSFHIPKKDQCDECHIFHQKKVPTEEEKSKFDKHQDNKKVARHLKSQDKKEAIESEGKILTAVFDFEKVLTCPHGNVSIYYYKRKLSCLNFTVFDMGKKKATCYMWDESVAKRGANEVSSCLLDFIENNVKKGAKEFRFWSDNCAGQNRNRIVFSLYVYAAKKFSISITHRFLEKGHTQNEGDSVHSVIERASETKMIYTPDEWRLLVKWSKILPKNISEIQYFKFMSLGYKYVYVFKTLC
uniref:Uncharacterized protein LOC114337629 n=1 Tax=Diabrotica virgifera virgifera TaxID=50390 RepID=A0A6P7G4Q1_DIAVI